MFAVESLISPDFSCILTPHIAETCIGSDALLIKTKWDI